MCATRHVTVRSDQSRSVDRRRDQVTCSIDSISDSNAINMCLEMRVLREVARDARSDIDYAAVDLLNCHSTGVTC